MVDTLKSIHFHTSSTMDSIWSTAIGRDGQHDLKTLCTALMIEGRNLPRDLSAEDHLLVLLVLLSTVNTLQCSLGPLTSSALSFRQRASRLSRQSVLQSSFGERTTTPTRGSLHTIRHSEIISFNPHTPFTTDRDYRHMRVLLSQSLTTWQKSFESCDIRQPDPANANLPETHSLMTLLYLARLLLDGGSAMYMLPSLAGYTTEPYETLPLSFSRPCAPHKIGIRLDDEVVQSAIGILDSVEAGQRTMNIAEVAAGQSAAVSPMWYPLALFYGALVVWGKVEEDQMEGVRSSSGRPFLVSRRILHAFHQELKTIEQDWECAGQMAEIVNALIK